MTITISSNIKDPNLEKWKLFNRVLLSDQTPALRKAWKEYGYDGLAKIAPEHFGFSKMYRNSRTYVTVEFTEEEWLMFCLRWL